MSDAGLAGEPESAPKRLAGSEDLRTALGRERWQRAKRMRLLYVLFFLPFVSLVIFHYMPIYGIIIAFKDYKLGAGFLASPWNNFEHFTNLFSTPFFARILRNTIIISLLHIGFGFPAPILLALLINEIVNNRFKRVVQSISYLPHFMSWVILAGIIVEILSPQRGVVAHVATLLGLEPRNVLTDRSLFRPMLVATGIWKEVGWGTVIYLAALSSINPELYESAAVDGAGRIPVALRITVPSLIPVMTILVILRLGELLNAGFDQIFNLYSPLVYEVADIIDTYVYRVGLLQRRYDFAAAVGLFKNAIGVALIVGSNAIIRRFSDYGLW